MMGTGNDRRGIAVASSGGASAVHNIRRLERHLDGRSHFHCCQRGELAASTPISCPVSWPHPRGRNRSCLGGAGHSLSAKLPACPRSGEVDRSLSAATANDPRNPPTTLSPAG